MPNRPLSKIIFVFVCIFGTLLTSACSKQPQTISETCQSQKYLGNGYILEIAEDKDTLKTIKITFHIDEDYLKAEKKTLKTLTSIDKLYQQYENQLYNEYLLLTQGNESLPYFVASYDTNADQHTIDVVYTYKVNNQVLLKTIKNPSNSMYEWFNYFSLMDGYNNETETFSAKKIKGSHRYQSIEKIKCKKTEKTFESD